MSKDETPEKYRDLIKAAESLVNDFDAQRAREAAAFEEGYRLGYGAGVDIGYARAEADMEKAWKPVAAAVRDIPRQQQTNTNRAKPADTLTAYCTRPGCKTQTEVPARVDFRRVLCPTHAPRKVCRQHRALDTCAYLNALAATQRPEFTGLRHAGGAVA